MRYARRADASQLNELPIKRNVHTVDMKGCGETHGPKCDIQAVHCADTEMLKAKLVHDTSAASTQEAALDKKQVC
uniref:Uncharacterized protein n=1 Tax=Ascaris lumbricoides TaxID=6252 RepID=A0A0M3HVW2_ASCLU